MDRNELFKTNSWFNFANEAATYAGYGLGDYIKEFKIELREAIELIIKKQLVKKRLGVMNK